MKSKINACSIATLAWSTIVLLFAVLKFRESSGPVALHWNMHGEVDRWGSINETLVIPISLFILTLSGISIQPVLKETQKNSVITDVITLILLGSDGYLGALCTGLSSAHTDPNNRIWLNSGNIFLLVVSTSFLYFAYSASRSRRVVMPGVNGVGTCLFDLRSKKIRTFWSVSLLVSGVVGIILCFIYSANDPVLSIAGGIPGLCISILLFASVLITIALSNTVLDKY